MCVRPAFSLAELTLPVLVITGDDDRIVPTEESLRLAEELPAAALTVIPNCGHVPQEECQGPFMQALVAFLVSEDGAAPPDTEGTSARAAVIAVAVMVAVCVPSNTESLTIVTLNVADAASLEQTVNRLTTGA